MNDFEKFVRELAAGGMKLEEIYEDFDNIIATLEHEQETKDDSDRDKMIDELWDVFYQSVDEDDLDVSDGVILTMLLLAEQHPEWTVKDMDEFCKQLDYCARKGAALVGKSPMEALGTLLGEVKGEAAKLNQMKEKKEVSPPPLKVNLSDEEKIRKFLDSLF